MTTAVRQTLDGALPPFIRRSLGLRSPRRFPYDALVRVRAGEQVYLLTHPDDVRHVLVANADAYSKTPRLVSPAGRRRVGRGVLSATGAEHLRQRRLLQPGFRREAVETIETAVQRVVEPALDLWGSATELELASELERIAKRVILTSLFGDELDDATRDGLEAAMAARRRHTERVHYGRLPLRDRLPTPVSRAHRAALALIDEQVAAGIARRRQAAPGDDLLARLLRARYDDGTGMTDELIRDEALTLLTTGYETLGDALTWIALVLGSRDEWDSAVADEAAALGPSGPGAADVERLPILESVVAETLRLFPPTWIYARVPSRDDVLPAGGPVRAGATLYVSPYVLHRHPRYFPEPERFDPTRFGPGERPPRYVYLPFGDGLHRCLGEHLARLELTLVTARVVRRFRLAPLGHHPPEPVAGVTLRARRPVLFAPVPRTAVTR